jgi:hypothetical protein
MCIYMGMEVESHPISSELSVCNVSSYQSAPCHNPENPRYRHSLEKFNILLSFFPCLSITEFSFTVLVSRH